MQNHLKAKTAFNQKLAELQKETLPVLYDQNLKEIVLYEKMLEMQEQLNKLTEKIEKKQENYHAA